MDKNASTWGFESRVEQHTQQREGLASGVIARKAGPKASIRPAEQPQPEKEHPGQYSEHDARRLVKQQQQQQQQQQGQTKLWNDTAAAQKAFRKEAQQRRLHNKEFHAKQSIRHRQQEYDQAVKARREQEGGLRPLKQQIKPQSTVDLPQIVPGISGNATSVQGPRARRLQAIARHPRPPDLAKPPRQISCIPDDLFLPNVAGAQAPSSAQGLIAETPDKSSMHYGYSDASYDAAALLPQLVSQGSRRLTQEMLHVESQHSTPRAW